ncbi:type 1 glutamine amidotransferase [Bdellovibrionota bacterium FG-1]
MKHLERRKPVLIVQHAPHEHPAALRRALESQGIQTLWIHPYQGEAYPERKEIAGIISLGGPMGANDEHHHPWIDTEITLMRECTRASMPVVGICLGGQMLARALGGAVEQNHIHEVGWFPIEVTSDGRKDPIIGAAGIRPTVYHWHGDTFHLPPNAVLLASSRACPRQAFRIGDHAYGFQFHPEADHQLVNEWMDLEGVEEEILAVQKDHGVRTVQDSQTQRKKALKYERASLKITTGIGALFRKRGCRQHQTTTPNAQFSKWVTLQTRLQIEFEGPDRKSVRMEGRIVTLLSMPAGDFVIFKDQNRLLWPIRQTDLTQVTALVD